MEGVFSRFLSSPGRRRPLKPNQNTIKVCKNRGPPFSPETLFFYQMYQKWPPSGPPKTVKKRQNDKKEPSETELKKNTKKKLKYKPVLAMEREARLKEERDPNESQNVFALQVVFGRACGAASTTFQIEKTKNPTSNQDSETSPKKRQNTSKVSPKWP